MRGYALWMPQAETSYLKLYQRARITERAIRFERNLSRPIASARGLLAGTKSTSALAVEPARRRTRGPPRFRAEPAARALISKRQNPRRGKRATGSRREPVQGRARRAGLFFFARQRRRNNRRSGWAAPGGRALGGLSLPFLRAAGLAGPALARARSLLAAALCLRAASGLALSFSGHCSTCCVPALVSNRVRLQSMPGMSAYARPDK